MSRSEDELAIRDLVARYPDCPRVLAGAKVPLRITSAPPGGKVTRAVAVR